MLFGRVQFGEQEDIRLIPAVPKILFGFNLNRIRFILKKVSPYWASLFINT